MTAPATPAAGPQVTARYCVDQAAAALALAVEKAAAGQTINGADTLRALAEEWRALACEVARNPHLPTEDCE